MYNNIFDTHSHYDDKQYDDDRDELLTRMFDDGVGNVVSCGCDLKTTRVNQLLSTKYDEFYFAAGIHPECLEECGDDDLEKIEEYAKDKKCLAIGEIGLDYHWMSSTKEKQKDYFIKQIEIAKQMNLPIIVHDRDAHQDTLDILKQTKPQGVVHCFSGSKEMAKEVIKLGMYIGINGVATFKNARKSLEVVKEVPIDRLVLETDCPYLAPEPIRGSRNNSLNISHIAEKLSEMLEIDPQMLIDITTKNAKRLYNL